MEEVPQVKSPLRAESARVVFRGDDVRLVVTLSSGGEVSFPLDRIDSFRRRPGPRKALATCDDALKNVVLEEGGYAIAWPALEVDFYVPEMLPLYLGFGKTASAVARSAGSTTSAAKRVAARANGAKGGRPRKAQRRAA